MNRLYNIDLCLLKLNIFFFWIFCMSIVGIQTSFVQSITKYMNEWDLPVSITDHPDTYLLVYHQNILNCKLVCLSLSLSPFLSHSLFYYDILIPRSHVSSIQWFIHIIRKNSISYRPLSMIQIWPHILLCKFLTLITLQSHYNWLIIFQKQFVSVVFKCTMTTIVGVRNQWHNYTKMVGRSFIIIKFKSNGEYRSSW